MKTIMHRAARGVKRNYRSFARLNTARYPDLQRRFQPLTDSLAKPKLWATTAFLAVITLVAVNIATQSQHKDSFAALPACTNTSPITPSNFASAVSGASADHVLCLEPGNYGNWAGTNKAVTIRGAEGGGSTMVLRLNCSSNVDAPAAGCTVARVKNFILEDMTIGGGQIAGIIQRSKQNGETDAQYQQYVSSLNFADPERPSDFIIRNSAFTASLVVDGVTNANILLDNNTYIGINLAPAPNGKVYCNGTPASVHLPYSSSTPSGVTISNSLFRDSHKDGVQTGAGVNIFNNEFYNIKENGAQCFERDDSPHTDPIQLLSARGSVVRGNYFYDVADGIVAYDRVEEATIEHNIIDLVGGRWGIELYSDKNSIIRHNTLLYRNPCAFNQPCGWIILDRKTQDPVGSGTQIYDNIASVIGINSGSTASVNNKNMLRSGASGTNFNGTPTYVGGAIPATIAGFTLAANSPGKNAASDGTDVGADITKVGRHTSSGIPIPTDITSPAITLSTPSGVQPIPVSGNTTVSANATDPGDPSSGIASVQFKLSGSNIGNPDTTAPYSIGWDFSQVANGTHTLTAVARDVAGNTTESSPISITVTGGLNVHSTLMAGYNFSEGSGTTAADVSGRNQTLALTNGPVWAGASGGKYGNAIVLDGTNDHAVTPDSNSLDLAGQGTISAWIKPDVIGPGWRGIISKGNANQASAQNYALELLPSGMLQCIIGNGSSSVAVSSSTAVSANTFYHVACVWNGSTLKVYIDGVERNSTAQTVTPAGNSAPLHIGKFGGAEEYLDGAIDDVRIYNIALSQSDMAADMNTGLTATSVPSPPLTTLAPTANGTLPLNSVVAVSSAVFNFTSSKPNSTFMCKLDGASYAACNSNNTTVSGTTTGSIGYSGLSQGSHNFSVYAIDADSNADETPEIFSWAIDSTGPNITMTSPTADAFLRNTITLEASANDAVSLSHVQFRRCNSSGGSCQNIGAEQTTPTAGTTYSISYNTAAVSNGSYRFTAVAYDTAGNSTTALTVPVTVDNTPPNTTIQTSPNANTAQTAATFNFVSTEPAEARFMCKLNSASYTVCGSGAQTYSNLAEGSYTFSVYAIDRAGNEDSTPASFTWIIDTTPPAISFSAPQQGITVSGNNVTVIATATDNRSVVGVQFKLNGSNLVSEDTTAPYQATWNTTQASNGQHTLAATARDAANNTTTVTITVAVNNEAPDEVAPTIPTSLRVTTAPTTSTIGLAWNASADSGGSGLGGYRLYRNGQPVTNAQNLTTTGYTDTGLTANTTYNYSVRAYDHSNNLSGHSTTLTVSTAKPAEPKPGNSATNNSNSTAKSRKTGDLDSNDRVNLRDLSMLLARYNSSDGLADLDGSGRVDLRDLSMLLARWEG